MAQQQVRLQYTSAANDNISHFTFIFILFINVYRFIPKSIISLAHTSKVAHRIAKSAVRSEKRNMRASGIKV